MIERWLELLAMGWIGIAIMMGALWLVQRARRDAGVVDVGWAAGLGLLAVFYATVGPGDPGRRVLVAALGAGWSLRLAAFLLRDRVLGHQEDGRYRALRRAWGRHAQLGFFAFFQAQGLVDVLLSIPFLVVMARPEAGLGPLDAAGALVWLVAVAGEGVADRQLAAWRANPANRGRTCRTGLWRYSRHPNYFFEWIHWWTYVVLAIGAPWGWLTLIGPGLMSLFLFRITGIPATEAQALASRGDDYRAYQRTTSALVPWPPRLDRA